MACEPTDFDLIEEVRAEFTLPTDHYRHTGCSQCWRSIGEIELIGHMTNCPANPRAISVVSETSEKVQEPVFDFNRYNGVK